jgi:hypothetical protein
MNLSDVLDSLRNKVLESRKIGWECFEFTSGDRDQASKLLRADANYVVSNHKAHFLGLASEGRVREHFLWWKEANENDVEFLFDIANEPQLIDHLKYETPIEFELDPMIVEISGVARYSVRLARLLDMIFDANKETRQALNVMVQPQISIEYERAASFNLLCTFLDFLRSKQENNGLIPIDFQTKPITKKKAAQLLGQIGNGNRAVEWLNSCIEHIKV